MTLLFIKRLNDTFEENAEKLIKEGKSEKEAYENKNRHYFFIPKVARWSVLSETSENIGEKVDQICRIIERENPDLDGVLTNTTYNDKRKYPDDRLRKLISHFNSPRLRNSDLERTDIFGDAFEYLLEQLEMNIITIHSALSIKWDMNKGLYLSLMAIVYHLPLIGRLKLNVAPLPSILLSPHILPL